MVDLGSLPDDIREKLAELDLELSEGNCTHHHLTSNNRYVRKQILSIPSLPPNSLPSFLPLCRYHCHCQCGTLLLSFYCERTRQTPFNFGLRLNCVHISKIIAFVSINNGNSAELISFQAAENFNSFRFYVWSHTHERTYHSGDYTFNAKSNYCKYCSDMAWKTFHKMKHRQLATS